MRALPKNIQAFLIKITTEELTFNSYCILFFLVFTWIVEQWMNMLSWNYSAYSFVC